MKSMLKSVLLIMAIIVGLVTALIASAMIPRDSIRKQVKSSAEYLNSDDEYFYPMVPGTLCSIQDRIADSVLLGIAYYLEADKPVESIVWSRFYWDKNHYKNESFLKSVNEDIPANTEYLRYWHGSLIFVRPLLIIMDVRQIYVFFSLVLAVLLIWLMIILIRNRLKTEAVAYALAMIGVNAWFVSLCLEYTWMFLICFIASIVSLNMAIRNKENHYGMLFLIIGIVSGFLDFLTTETITWLIPLMLIIRIRIKQGKNNNWKLALKSGMLWGIGYGGMWALKWVFASAVLRENVLPYLSDSFELHTSVSTSDSTVKYIFDAIGRNLSCLFPIGYGTIGIVISLLVFMIAVFIPIARNRVSLKKNIRWHQLALYAFIGVVPYIRYMVLHFHAWYHFFFTYRAQASSVMALCFIIMELIDINSRKKAVIAHA